MNFARFKQTVAVCVGLGVPAALACDPSDPEILRSVQDFVTATGATSASVGCDSGGFTSDNCRVAGVRIDRSCSRNAGESPEQQARKVAEIQAALRDIRGAGGLGCVNSVNGPLAAALLKVFAMTSAFTVCCDQCEGAGLPRDAVPGSSCGMSLPRSVSGQETVVLNTGGPGSVLGTGVCGTASSPQPIRKLLLHEMLHVAGLAGSQSHSGGGAIDPETGARLEERDFLADPVYGCEKLCYGSAVNLNSISCLACSRGVASETDMSHTGPPELARRLREAEQLVVSSPESVPGVCRALWDRPNDPGRRHLRSYVDGLREILPAKELLTSCMKINRIDTARLRSATSATELADSCATQAESLRNACAGFGRAVSCRRPALSSGIYTDEVLSSCRESIDSYRQSVLSMLRIYARSQNTEFRAKVSDFDCTRYFPTAALCPGVGTGTELLVQSCRNALVPTAAP